MITSPILSLTILAASAMETSMPNKGKTEIFEYGLHVYRTRHQAIRKLKRLYSPGYHGFRVWPSSWLLMDFLENRGLPAGARVMEVGCGWGLAGIYCAKRYGAEVTGVDKDCKVFPYLNLHADLNRVHVVTVEKCFDEISHDQLKGIDVMIGGDICFWDSMVHPLERLVDRAKDAGVRLILFSDPGRITFAQLSENLIQNMGGEMWNRTVQYPYPFHGKILKMDATDFKRTP